MSDDRFGIEPIHKRGELDLNHYGAKAVQLRRIANLGLATPTGFFIPKDIVAKAIDKEDVKISKRFGKENGLYSLRASPGDPSWGSIDAIINLGINDSYVREVEPQIGKRAALEIYRQFIHHFSVSVFGMDGGIFESIYFEETCSSHIEDGSFCNERTLLSLVELSKTKFRDEIGMDFPQEFQTQLDLAFQAMSRSWYRPSAQILRSTRGAPPNASIGIILQKMVLGVGSELSGSGKVNTIDGESGDMEITGYFLPNSQGNESITDARVPHLLSEKQRVEKVQYLESLEKLHPPSFNMIKNTVKKTLVGFGEALELEFIIDNNEFYLLDTAIAPRSARASVRVVVELVKRNILSEEDALLRVSPQNLIEFLHPQISSDTSRDVVGSGLPASPGAVSGRVVFSSQSASVFNAKGQPAILVRIETSPEDIAGIHDSVGVLTSRGGMTSHAAVIARGLGLPCVVGVSSLTMNVSKKTMVSDLGYKFREGDLITLDGTSGQVLSGSVKMNQPKISGDFSKVMEWSDKHRLLSVRGNADTWQEVQLAKDFGADGIGLCRTEHMFFEPTRLLVMRQMILADGKARRREALRKLLPMQRDDFIKIFEIMKGQPTTIRLLDPPLHEFLPHSKDELRTVARAMDVPLSKIIERTKELEEFNPMLGKRGVRLGITLPEIYEMQAQAIFEAVSFVNGKGVNSIVPEIMIPLVSTKKEVDFIRKSITEIAERLSEKLSHSINYKLGIVVETPRAALKADDLCTICDFLSFGTNDLTQMTYGLSRDDAGRFMRDYLEKGVFENDPFHSLDLEGVGELILIAVERARSSDKVIEVGLCGEHGGDPSSIQFCLKAKFDYVSCSPFRIPIAKLAAAQATILQKRSVGD